MCEKGNWKLFDNSFCVYKDLRCFQEAARNKSPEYQACSQEWKKICHRRLKKPTEYESDTCDHHACGNCDPKWAKRRPPVFLSYISLC